MRGFHGRKWGALASGRKYPWPSNNGAGLQTLPYNDLDALKAAVTTGTAAVLLEVVQGEGGVHPGKADFLQGVQAICRENGTLLVIDEVQTGFGRTGKMFAFQHYGLQPDLLCVAKSIAGGIPMGATFIAGKFGEMPSHVHVQTIDATPLLCGFAGVRYYIQDNCLGKRRRNRGLFRDHLSRIIHAVSRSARTGIDGRDGTPAINYPYLQALKQEGVMALPPVDVMRFYRRWSQPGRTSLLVKAVRRCFGTG